MLEMVDIVGPAAEGNIKRAVRDRAFRAFLTAPGTVVENLVRVLRMESDALPGHVVRRSLVDWCFESRLPPGWR
jgi:hypothetical protein